MLEDSFKKLSSENQEDKIRHLYFESVRECKFFGGKWVFNRWRVPSTALHGGAGMIGSFANG
ncbi:hypothetical protein BAG01nite_11980 [Brevibacillus agri]|uniref:Uncharacterized protein n=1 Tax=Brevibacillus agri TaxID=51101 RepID=A0ABQ0SMJ5_9BACL|nr:hypothetical protein BAG01nite_11980 [Brevibacillus agri]